MFYSNLSCSPVIYVFYSVVNQIIIITLDLLCVKITSVHRWVLGLVMLIELMRVVFHIFISIFLWGTKIGKKEDFLKRNPLVCYLVIT